MANKEGRFIPFLKLSTLPDRRFSYRKEVLPTSIHPVNAALLMKLAEGYMKKDAKVLDPFCGTGTMLIERARLHPCDTLYGIDILEEAISKARYNAEKANIPIHYINRNYFDFRHSYRFDEIITNLPGMGKNKDVRSVEVLYDRFLQKSNEVLEKNGMILVYTTMPKVWKEVCEKHPEYTIEKEAVINEREDSRLFVLTFQLSED